MSEMCQKTSGFVICIPAHTGNLFLFPPDGDRFFPFSAFWPKHLHWLWGAPWPPRPGSRPPCLRARPPRTSGLSVRTREPALKHGTRDRAPEDPGAELSRPW